MMRPHRSMTLVSAFCLLTVLLAAVSFTVPTPFHTHVTQPVSPSSSFERRGGGPLRVEAAHVAVHSMHSATCTLDQNASTLPHHSHMRSAPLHERYLLFAPSSGASLPASLRHAAHLALWLNRTLVLPHLLGPASAPHRIPFSAAVDLDAFRRRRTPLRVIEIDAFASIHAMPQCLLVLHTPQAAAPPNSLASAWEYFDRIRAGSSGGEGRPPMQLLHVEVPSWDHQLLREAFSACDHHLAIAVHRVFPWEGAISAIWNATSPFAEEHEAAFAPLLVPTLALERVAERIASIITMRSSLANPTSAPKLMCLWAGPEVTEAACGRLMSSLRESASAAIIRLLGRGFACSAKSGQQLLLNVRHVHRVQASASWHPLAADRRSWESKVGWTGAGDSDDVFRYVDLLDSQRDPEPSCSTFQEGHDFSGYDCRCMGPSKTGLVAPGLPNANACARLCGQENTPFFSYRVFDGSCWCKTSDSGRRAAGGFSSGPSCLEPRRPPAPPPLPVPPMRPTSFALFSSLRREQDDLPLALLNGSSIDDFVDVLSQADLGMPLEISKSILERLVCARATTLLLNAFAPSSAVVRTQARIYRSGTPTLASSESTAPAKYPRTFYLRRHDPFDDSQLLTAIQYGEVQDSFSRFERILT